MIDLLSLIYPKRACCMGCGSQTGLSQDWLCPECADQLAATRLTLAKPPNGCRVDGAAFAHPYAGPAGGIVRRFKYDGVWRLSDAMASDMLQVWHEAADYPVDTVTCVPMHPRRIRARGYNHAQLLAERIAQALSQPFEPLLYRTRYVPGQASLTIDERRRGLTDAFAATEAASGRRVLLVDDVCTTGTTAHACAENLRSAGAERVYLLCYAVAYENL